MDDRRIELEAKERNKNITKLEEKELDLLKKLKDVQNEQTTESLKTNERNLQEAAVGGDTAAQQEISDRAVAEHDQQYRDDAMKDLDKKAEEKRKVDEKALEEERRVHDERTGNHDSKAHSTDKK